MILELWVALLSAEYESKIYTLDIVKSDVNEWKKEFDMSMYGTDARMKDVSTSAINNER